MYLKRVIHVQSCWFAQETILFFFLTLSLPSSSSSPRCLSFLTALHKSDCYLDLLHLYLIIIVYAGL